MAKPAGPRCNLDCGYCYYLCKKKYYPGSSFIMEEVVLREYIRQFIESQFVEEVVFEWQGGEPTLLGLDYFQKIIAIEQEYCRPGQVIKNSLQTNGTLINEQWCRFFKENDFLIGISMDGPPELHDPYRVDRKGAATHERVAESIRMMNRFKVEYNVLCCVSHQNVAHPVTVYRYFRDVMRVQFIQFIPIVKMVDYESTDFPPALTEHSITGEEYGAFLVAVFDEWIKRDVGKIYVQIFDAALNAWYGNPATLCVLGKTCGNGLAIEHNGDVYACDHYVFPDYFLGNILKTDLGQIAGSALQRHFGEIKFTSLPSVCKQCEWLFVCNGGCPKNRLSYSEDGERGLNNLCAGYKRFFSHVDKPMQYMVRMINEQKAPAEVMAWMKRRNKK